MNLLICAVLAFQVGMPLSYYLGDRGYDERFSWRMFSTLRVRSCRVDVTEYVREHGTLRAERVDVERDIHVAWLRLLERMRNAVVDAYLERRCERPNVQKVQLECHCDDTDGRALPTVRRELECPAQEAER